MSRQCRRCGAVRPDEDFPLRHVNPRSSCSTCLMSFGITPEFLVSIWGTSEPTTGDVVGDPSLLPPADSLVVGQTEAPVFTRPPVVYVVALDEPDPHPIVEPPKPRGDE